MRIKKGGEGYVSTGIVERGCEVGKVNRGITRRIDRERKGIHFR